MLQSNLTDKKDKQPLMKEIFTKTVELKKDKTARKCLSIQNIRKRKNYDLSYSLLKNTAQREEYQSLVFSDASSSDFSDQGKEKVYVRPML